MQSDPGGNFLAKRQTPLVADDPVAGAFIAVAGRNDQTKSRREGRRSGPFFERLVAVVQQDITNAMLALSFIGQVIRRNCVRKLMILPVDWPFLSERKGPATLLWATTIECLKNMLHYTRLLIVGFFDEKTVVFDNFDRFLLGRGNSPNTTEQKNCQPNFDQSPCLHCFSQPLNP